MSYEELEKKLCTALESEARINDFCEKMLIKYEQLFNTRESLVPALKKIEIGIA